MTRNLEGWNEVCGIQNRGSSSLCCFRGWELHTRIQRPGPLGRHLQALLQINSVVAWFPMLNVAILTHPRQGDTRTITTNADGIYSAPNLNPGTYSATVHRIRIFRSWCNPGLSLTVGATANPEFEHAGSDSRAKRWKLPLKAPTVNLSNAEIGGPYH